LRLDRDVRFLADLATEIRPVIVAAITSKGIEVHRFAMECLAGAGKRSCSRLRTPSLATVPNAFETRVLGQEDPDTSRVNWYSCFCR
jgi:hypothetical protein